MILEGLHNYRFNLQYCYNSIVKKEHLGVADKYLIKKRYDQIIRQEAIANIIDYEIITKSEISKDDSGPFESGVSEAGNRISIDEQTIKYF